MRWLRRIGMVLLVLAVLLVAWEPTPRRRCRRAVMLPNLLDAGPKPLNLFSDAPRRTSVPYRTDRRGG